MKIFRTEVGSETAKAPGTVAAAGKAGIDVACGDGHLLRILELQPQGGRRMAAADYLGKQCRAESFTVGEVTVRQSGGQSTAVMAETLRQTAERLMRPYAASGEFCFRGVRG